MEWTFYSELAPQTPGASVCPVYDCAIDHETKNCHFLMPDLSITHAEAPEDWKDRPHEQVVGELLKYHVRWWNDSRLDKSPFLARLGGPLRMAQAGLPENVRANCEECVGHLQTFVAKAGDELEHEWVDTMEKVIDRYADVFLARVEGGKHLTLLHGDSDLGNLYYPKDTKRDRLILFDWETYKRGLGAYDLAYMLVHGTAGRREIESPLMDLYYEKLMEAGIGGYTRDDFEYDFRLSIVSTTFCAIIWKRVFSMRRSMEAFADWKCDELLD